MPKSVETAIGISQPPATLPEIVPLQVPIGPFSPTGEIMFNPIPEKHLSWRIRTQPVEIVNPHRVSRRRGRSRGSRGHSNRRCGVCEECRKTQGSFIRSRCRGWMVGQPGRLNMVDTKLL